MVLEVPLIKEDLSTWVVKVELALECLGLLLWGEDPIETVLAENGHLPLVVVNFVLPKHLHDLAAHRRLATQKEYNKQHNNVLSWFLPEKNTLTF